VESIAAAVGVKISLSKTYRVFSKISNRSRKIVAESTSIQNKRNLMEGVKKTKLTGKTVDSKWNNDSIYINNGLTQFNKIYFLKLEFLLEKRVTNSHGLRILIFFKKE
jgi:hypothetical protein